MSHTPRGEEKLTSGQMTPGGIAKQFSQLDLPAPSNLHLERKDEQSQPTQGRPRQDSRDLSEALSHLNLPEPEALRKERQHRRTESQSQDLSEQLSRMKLPQPERIFGGKDKFDKAREDGVNADEWEKVTLPDDVPEAVKSPTLERFRRDSRSQS